MFWLFQFESKQRILVSSRSTVAAITGILHVISHLKDLWLRVWASGACVGVRTTAPGLQINFVCVCVCMCVLKSNISSGKIDFYGHLYLNKSKGYKKAFFFFT